MVPALIALGLLILFVIVVSLRRDDFTISRSAQLSAPPDRVLAEIDDLRRYAVWNPWGKYDPSAKITFSGPPRGPGAVMAWSGNARAGAGRLTVEETRPGEFTRFRLDFLRPFPSTAFSEFTLRPEGQRTLVTWTMTGRHSFVPKAIGLFINMDRLIGQEFEKGLAELESRLTAGTDG